MRKTIFLALSLFLCLSFAPHIDKLIGKWHVEKVILEDGKETEGFKFLEFLKDGSIQGGTIGKKASKFGKWSYDEEDNILTLSSEKERGDDGDYKVLKLTDSLLIIEKDMVEIHLKKS